MKVWVCSVCGWIYDEGKGDADSGGLHCPTDSIAPTKAKRKVYFVRWRKPRRYLHCGLKTCIIYNSRQMYRHLTSHTTKARHLKA